jgi:hypothetical protein
MKGLILLFILLQASIQSIAQASFEKDTISTKNLSEFLLEELKTLDESSKEFQFLKENLQVLEMKDRKAFMLRKLNPNPTVINCAIVIQLTYPPLSEKQIIYKDDICIKWWIQREIKKYKVEIKNYYGDVLMSFVTSANEVTLKKDELDKFIEHESKILFSIKDNSSKEEAQYFPVVKSSDDDKQITFACTPDKPILSLISGLYTELNFNSLVDAKTYYELANKLSGDPHYQILLDNFNLRNKKQ